MDRAAMNSQIAVQPVIDSVLGLGGPPVDLKWAASTNEAEPARRNLHALADSCSTLRGRRLC
jgi:hypothetical protein